MDQHDRAAAQTARRRVELIRRLGLLDRDGDPALSALVRLASYVTGAEAAAVHVIDDELQHRVAAHGAPLGDHPREDSMCRLVVDEDERIVCADATRDERFGYSSFVHGPDPVRFYMSVPLRVSDGTVVGTLCAWDTRPAELSPTQVARFEDLAEQAAARIELTAVARQLGQAATHDALTGVLNRLLLSDRLAQAFARRRRHGGEVLAIVADVDAFKPINDRYGHAAGDAVLVEVAHRLSAVARTEDTVARIGGDEFVVVAELGDEAHAQRVVERIEAALAEPMAVAGTELRVGVTLGAVVAHPGDDVAGLLARADAEMYARKPSR